MKFAHRRRLAVGAVLSTVATVLVGVTLTGSSSASVLNVSPSSAGNYPSYGQPVAVTFTLSVNSPPATPNAVPPGSEVIFTRTGSSPADTFHTSVTTNTPNASGQQQPATSVDLTNPMGNSTDTKGSVPLGPADPGDYDVTFKDAAGQSVLDSCSSCFHVVAAGAPTVTSLSPSQIAGSNGSAVSVKVTGSNLAYGTTLSVVPAPGGSTDVTVQPDNSSTGGTSKDGTTKSYLFTVPANAVPGKRDIQVLNTDGKSSVCTGCFTVLGPNLTGVTPGAATNTDADNAQTVTFTGPAGSIPADGVPSLAFTGDPGGSTKAGLSIPATSVTSRAGDGSSITAVYNLVAAAPGDNIYLPTVSSPTSVSVCTCAFSIVQPTGAPTLASLSPNQQDAGTTQQVTVTGTNFAKGANVLISGADVTVTSVSYVSRSQLTATVAVASTATSGARDVTVKNTDSGTSPVCTGCYTINGATSSASTSATPTATMSSPSSPCPTPSPTASGSSSPSASSTALPIIGSTSASPSGSSTTSASSSASPTSATAGCLALEVSVSPTDITPTVPSTVSIHGSPNAAVDLYAYSRPSTTYGVVRSGVTDGNGNLSFAVKPGNNTRLYAHYRDGSTTTASNDSPSVVINVHTALSLSVYRDGFRQYHFQGRNLPRLAGQLITLYRIDGSGNEIRTATVKTDSSGIWRIYRTFTGSGTFRFVARTGKTLNNAAGVSNLRTVTID